MSLIGTLLTPTAAAVGEAIKDSAFRDLGVGDPIAGSEEITDGMLAEARFDAARAYRSFRRAEEKSQESDWLLCAAAFGAGLALVYVGAMHFKNGGR